MKDKRRMEKFLKDAVESYLQQTTKSPSSSLLSKKGSSANANASEIMETSSVEPASALAPATYTHPLQPRPKTPQGPLLEKSEEGENSHIEGELRSNTSYNASRTKIISHAGTQPKMEEEKKICNTLNDSASKVAVPDKRVPLLLCPYKKIDITETHAKLTLPYRHVVVKDNTPQQDPSTDLLKWKKELGDLYDKCIRAGREAFDKRFTYMAKEMKLTSKGDAHGDGIQGHDIRGYNEFQEYVLHPDFHRDPTVQMQHLEKIVIFLRRLREEIEWLEVEVSTFCKTVGKHGITVSGDKSFAGNRHLGIQRTSDGFVKTLFKKGHLDHQIEPLKKKLRRKYGVWFVKLLNANLGKNKNKNSSYETKKVVEGGKCMGYIVRPAVSNLNNISIAMKDVTEDEPKSDNDDISTALSTDAIPVAAAIADDSPHTVIRSSSELLADRNGTRTDKIATDVSKGNGIFLSNSDEEFLEIVQQEMKRRGMDHLATCVASQLQQRHNSSPSLNLSTSSDKGPTNTQSKHVTQEMDKNGGHGDSKKKKRKRNGSKSIPE